MSDKCVFARFLGVAVGLLLSSAALGQVNEKSAAAIQAPVDGKAILALIAQLGDDSFEIRQAADEKLAAIGEPALALLEKAAKEGMDAETRERASQLLHAIEGKLFSTVLSTRGHKNRGTRLAITPDGKRFVSGGWESIQLWDIEGKPIKRFGDVGNRPSMPGYWSLSISSDGTRILAGCDDHFARVYDLSTGQETQKLAGHEGPIWGVAFLDGGKRALTGGKDKSLRVWDVATGKQLASFPAVVDGVRCMALSPDGKTVAIGHFGEGKEPKGTVRLWDIAQQKEIRALSGHAREVSCVSFSADGKLLVSSGYDQTVRVWEVATGKELQRFSCVSRMECAAFVDEGRQVLCAGNEVDPTLQLWDVKEAKRLLRSPPVPGGFLAVSPLPGERKAITAGRDGMIRYLEWKK